MVYTAELKAGIGAVRKSLQEAGLGQQDPRFRAHGQHEPAAHAPLVLVACSGGRDSMALAALAVKVCPTLGLKCGAVIVDHGLQADSAQVSAQAVGRCQDLGLDPVVNRRVQVVQAAEGLEAAARQARYGALTAVAQELGADAILLAHTADDQAEGLLIGLIRSAGLKALAGMSAQSRRDGLLLLRPLLGLRRSQTTAICQQLGIRWWDDPTNGDRLDPQTPLPASFPLRSRVRHDLLPALSAFAGKDMGAQLARSARLAKDDQDYIDQEALRLLSSARCQQEPEPIGVLAALRVSVLKQAHPAVRAHAWACLFQSLNLAVSSQQIGQVDALVTHWHGQGRVTLPSFYSATRKGHVILICKDREHANR
ncbi:tRNA(Ile)-lysidine synthase [Bombiscardovia nodaiensis]|uniref:tRNA(Ile)-lysidine synthase n=1 Tax=Bombiscardovia nodaiensis TaxID=2932181 RepID=A0ABN6S8S9_9BIFI|nr:tRNA(Ile)-lysidine synthase [Bombiscardovia nodaiensis]